MQPTEDWRTDVYVQFVATYVTEPTTSYMVLRYNGVNVNISRLEHATLPNGATVPMEQHFTCLYFRIYRGTPATYVESKSNMLTFAMHAIHIYRFVRQTNTHMPVKSTDCANGENLSQKNTQLTWYILQGRPRLLTRTVHIYRVYTSMMTYDIPMQPRRFHKGYPMEPSGKASQTSQSDLHTAMHDVSNHS